MNGGRKEDFDNMNYDDIQLLYLTYSSYQNAMVHKIADVITKMFGGE